MRKVISVIVGLFIISQLMVSCSSDSNVLGQFSKRKYLKKFKEKNVKLRDDINKIDYRNDYEIASEEIASTYLKPTYFEMPEVEETDDSEKIVLDDEQTTRLNLLKIANSNYSKWNKFNRSTHYFNSKNVNNNIIYSNQKKRSDSNSPIITALLVVLAIFIPPLAVVLKEGVSTNFWINFFITLAGFVAYWLLGSLSLANIILLVAIIHAIIVVLQ